MDIIGQAVKERSTAVPGSTSFIAVAGLDRTAVRTTAVQAVVLITAECSEFKTLVSFRSRATKAAIARH